MRSSKVSNILDKTTKTLFVILLFGSIFLVSGRYADLFDTYRKYWTIILSFVFLASLSINIWYNNGEYVLPIHFFLKTILVIGVLESLYALAQFGKMIPSYNPFFTYSGSFDNPAIFAMYLSFCVPISVYYANCDTTSSKRRVFWWIFSFALFVFICFSESRSGILAALLSSFIIILGKYDSLRDKMLSKKFLLIIIPIGIALLLLMYKVKADSANGRLLMWRVSMEMIKDKPFWGFGHDGFEAHYMNYQAEYLLHNSDSSFSLLADNVNHPFNEYLLFLIRYGFIRFTLLIAFLFMLFRRIKAIATEYRYVILGFIISIMTWCAFSYPCSVPFIWITTGLIIIVICYDYLLKWQNIPVAIMLIISTIGILVSVRHYLPESDWKKILHRSLAGETEKVLSDYQRLYERLKNNKLFLYNYGAELHQIGHYEESLSIMNECSIILNDYDVQLILGDCYEKMGDAYNAINHYTQAGYMVPNKFIPHYYIMRLSLQQGDTLKAIDEANLILNKDIKIDRSAKVRLIIQKAREVVNMRMED